MDAQKILFKKACRKCKHLKPVQAFGKQSRAGDGLTSTCKECRSYDRISPKGKRRRELLASGLRECRVCGSVKPDTRENFCVKHGKLEFMCRACTHRKDGRNIRLRRESEQLAHRGLKKCRACHRELPFNDFRGLRAWECNDCHLKAQTERAQRPVVRARKRLQSTDYRNDPRNAEKIRARSEVNKAIKRGDMQRGDCSICGKPNADAHHHNGYDEAHWFDIEWLCRRCHMRSHKPDRMKSAMRA